MNIEPLPRPTTCAKTANVIANPAFRTGCLSRSGVSDDMLVLSRVMAAPLHPAEAPLAQLPADHPAQSYAALPARELVRLIQSASSQRTEAVTQDIFTALYYRYYGYLFTVVSNSLGFIHDRDGIREIVDDAFAGFFRASPKFNLALAPDDAGCDQLVRSYLGKLAKWKASDARSFQKSFGADVLEIKVLEEHMNQGAQSGVSPWADDAEEKPADPRAERVSNWLSSLREVQRDVLRTYFLDDHPGRKSGKLPGGVAQSLAEKHNTTTSNIRHIKLKLQEQMRENFKNF